MTRFNKHLITVAALFAVGMMIIPGVAASDITADSAKSTLAVQQIKPELEAKEVTLAFSYNFDNQLFTTGGLQKSTATATINVKCPDSNIIVTGAQTIGFDVNPTSTSNTGQTSVPFATKLAVSVTRDLPGLKNFKCDYDATVTAIFAPAIDEATGGKSSFTVSAAYYPLLQAKVAQQIKQAGPQKDVPFEIQLDNLGNARTQIQFNIDERPEGDRWVAAVPDDVILYSPTNPIGATSGTAVFTVTTTYKNGWNNEQGTYRIKMSSFAADDPEQQGVDLATNVVIRVRGVYVPGFEPVAMLGAVLGTALLARLRKEE